MLKIDKLTMRFGGLTAMNSLEARVEPKKIVSVIGPNGAGKTTVFNAITGIYDPTEGDFFLEGQNMVKTCKPHTILAFIAIGILLGLLFLLIRPKPPLYHAADGRVSQFTLQVEALWCAGISDPFDPSKPQEYSFVTGMKSAFAFIAQDPAGNTVFFLVGFLIGVFGAVTIWQRGRRTSTRIAQQGISRTFQNIRLFKEMTVLENVLIAMDRFRKVNLILTALAFWRLKDETLENAEAMAELTFVGLAHRAAERAGSLPYGEQRRLEIARALATRPKMLLLDEPAAGMNPVESGHLMELVQRIQARGITVLLIEHHMKVVMGLSDHIIVLDHGVKIAEGDAKTVSTNPLVIEAYLGKEELG